MRTGGLREVLRKESWYVATIAKSFTVFGASFPDALSSGLTFAGGILCASIEAVWSVSFSGEKKQRWDTSRVILVLAFGRIFTKTITHCWFQILVPCD